MYSCQVVIFLKLCQAILKKFPKKAMVIVCQWINSVGRIQELDIYCVNFDGLLINIICCL